jgi:alpha-L-fucosidase 2
MMRSLPHLLLLLPVFATDTLCAALPPVRDEVDWPAFLARHDLVWEQLPRQWNEGAFVGNGQLGVMLYASLTDNRLDFHLGRVDVTDHRKAPDRRTSMGVPGAGVMFDFPRLDVGRMALRPAGKILDGTLRQDLWNAEITGVIKTDLGELRLRLATLRDRMVHLVEITSTEKNAAGLAQSWRWEFLPGNADSPRAQVKPDQAAEQKYQSNPPSRMETVEGLPVCVQPLLAGGDYATAWLEDKSAGSNTARLLISTANEVPAAGLSAARAVADVRAASRVNKHALLDEHRAWWHAFYPQAFLTLPDARMESFYWIQMYKLAAAWREDAPAIDLFGPWFRVSQWPGVWWNLNIQLTYWPVYAGNRLAIGRNYLDLVDAQFDTTFANGIKGKVIGDFAWALHNYWWQLRFAGDWRGVQEKWTPKARRIVDAYTSKLVKNAKGRLELPGLGSPEYKGFAAFNNTTYNLALFRWLLTALLEVDARSGQPASPEAQEWRRLLTELVDYPVDSNGLMIGSDQAVDESHRHFSHLLPLYPLYVLDPDNSKDRELLLRSARHWHHIGEGKGLAGYSFTGGSSIYASLGLGDEALGMLNDFFNNARGGGKVLPNTLYVESGGKNPVIETPLSAASAIMDLLLQSWGGKIRIFPAVPSAWADAGFRDLRAMDGFLVSAAREKSATRWVAITSEAGEACVLKVPDWSGPLEARAARNPEITLLGPGEYRVDLRKGENVVLFPSGCAVSAHVQAVSNTSGFTNPFGVKRGGELKTQQTWTEPSAQP